MSYTAHYFQLAFVVAVFVWIAGYIYQWLQSKPSLLERVRMNPYGFIVVFASCVAVPILLANLGLLVIDIWIATILIWLATIITLQVFARLFHGVLLLLVSLALPMSIALMVIAWQSLWLNNILLLVAVLGLVYCVLRFTHISRDGILLLLAFGALVDVLIVWVLPSPARLSQSEPEIFTLVLTVGKLSLGAIDLVALLLLARIVMSPMHGVKGLLWSIFVASTVLFVLVLDSAGVFISRSFPFLLAVLPFAYIGIAIQGIQKRDRPLTPS